MVRIIIKNLLRRKIRTSLTMLGVCVGVIAIITLGALANQPPLVLADEPTGSLDTSAGQELMKLLKELNPSQGVTFVIVTHDPAVARQTRRVLVMADGKIVREDRIGSPLEEDLKMWRHSGLGERIYAGEHADLHSLGISDHQVEDVKAVLELANGN